MTIQNTFNSPRLPGISSTSAAKRPSTGGATSASTAAKPFDTSAQADANGRRAAAKPRQTGLVGNHVDTTA